MNWPPLVGSWRDREHQRADERGNGHHAGEHPEQHRSAGRRDEFRRRAEEGDRKDAQRHADEREQPVRSLAARDRAVRETQSAGRRHTSDNVQNGHHCVRVRRRDAHEGKGRDTECERRREPAVDATEARREVQAAGHRADKE